MMAGMDIQTFNSFGWLLTAGIVVVVFFLLCRQFVLWYFRISQIADDLHVIAQHYRQLSGATLPAPTRPSPVSAATPRRQSLSA